MLGQRLFYFMDVKQTITNAVDKVEEAVGLKPATPTVEQTPPVAPVAPAVQQPTEPAPDRSAYNCLDCKGEGLKLLPDGTYSQTERCTNCGGTGKV